MATASTKENKELNQVAKDIYNNVIFCSDVIPPEKYDLLGMIFLPLALAGLEDTKNVGMIVAPYSSQLPRSINGMPIFSAMIAYSIEDSNYIREKIKFIHEAMQNI